MERVATPAEVVREPRRWGVGALVGLLSGAVALGIAQLAAGILGGASSPMIAVGSSAIDASPPWLKDFAIREFGSNDKRALLMGIGAILAIAAALLGAASVRRPSVGAVGILAFGVIGIAASVSRPANGPADAIPSVIGTLAGLAAYIRLREAAGLEPLRVPAEPTAPPEPAQPPTPPAYDRRRFLWTGAAAAGLAAVSGFVGQYLVRRSDASASREAVRIPAPADVAPPPPAGADLHVPGLGPFLTPNDRFYRVDTALFVPAVDANGWSLHIHGMVDREVTIDFAQLLARPLIERDITLTCVSNPVGGPYIGNARWIGAPLKPLLEEAGVRSGASQIVTRSADGFTVGTPTAVAMDGRDAMLAVAMNGEPLPLAHGFPVRMIVPGLYGYVSATKWIVDMELTTFEAYDAYWVQRGWSQRAPIKTESRIDTPRGGASLQPGTVQVAGVAWAQHRGIERVEVRADDGPWTPATLGAEDTVDTWRQWVLPWNATSGRHTLSVRATDGTGEVQTPADAAPVPNGATGDHTIFVVVA
ncbi:MAG TPA: molybdopterin-dependent oxidoreductase [Actinomycetota bacterium]|nr:molybdopterin-dependent oxidoreductase [Actinomycetota bacterium]